MVIQGLNSASVFSLRSEPPTKTLSTSLQVREPSANQSSRSESASSEDRLAEQRKLQELRNIDRRVRAHELAHVSVGGRYVTSGASFRYETGPDGRRYAVAGEVSIDTSEVAGDPRATLEKAQIVLRAALAPADPSAQDRRVAAQAVATIQQARVELAVQLEESPAGGQIDLYA